MDILITNWLERKEYFQYQYQDEREQAYDQGRLNPSSLHFSLLKSISPIVVMKLNSMITYLLLLNPLALSEIS
jgi:hypothetical protein